MLPPKKTRLELYFLTLPEESCMFYILCIPAILSNVSRTSDWSIPATRTLTLHYIYCGLKEKIIQNAQESEKISQIDCLMVVIYGNALVPSYI